MADAYNNRAQVFGLSYANELGLSASITGNFNIVSDVAADKFAQLDLDPIYDYSEIAVLDQGNCRVNFYNALGNCEYKSTLFSTGTGDNQLKDPRSLCYGRWYTTHYPGRWLYVADNGNKRVIMRSLPPSISFYSTEDAVMPDGYTPFSFMENAYLTSVAVDNYGFVYVVDAYNSKIYMFDAILSQLIGCFGSTGTADGQLLYPADFNVAKGLIYNPYRMIPEALGDAFATEYFSTTTGIRRYLLGFDVLAHSGYYVPKPIETGYDYLKCKWFQTGVTSSVRKLYYGGELKFSASDALNVAGDMYAQCLLYPDDPASGWFKYEITITSKYDATYTKQIKDSIWVERYVAQVSSGVFDPEGEVPKTCLYDDDEKLWGVYVNTEAYYPTVDTLWYYWAADDALLIDTSVGYASDFHVTTQDTLLFRASFNGGSTTSGYYHIATVQVYDHEPEHVDRVYWPTEPGMDTISIYAVFYNEYCSTPCTTCTDDDPIDDGCPMLYSWQGMEYQLVNNILPQSEEDDSRGDKLDVLPLFNSYLNGTNGYWMQIREDEQEISYLDGIELYAVDIPLSDGQLVYDQHVNVGYTTGKVFRPIRAVTNTGKDILEELHADDGDRFAAYQPGYMDLEYNLPVDDALAKPDASLSAGTPQRPPSKDIRKTVASDGQAREPNIHTLYALNAANEYKVVDKAYPRMIRPDLLCEVAPYVSDAGLLKLRLEWTREITLDDYPCIEYRKVEAEPQRLSLTSATHSANGVVTTALNQPADDYVTLEPGQSIDLAFAAEPVADSMRRVLLFKASGRYETIDGRGASKGSVPESFEFTQNYPNPFNPSTTFDFSLPSATDIKLEIYNILGQKVVTLVEGRYEAGRHTVAWTGSDAGGAAVSSGVYFAKLSAGTFTATKKMVVVK